MTTIAVNKTSMACDLQITYGGIAMKMDTKVVRLSEEQAFGLFGCKRALVGFAGPTAGWGKFHEWLSGMHKKAPKLGGTELIALTDRGIMSAHNINTWMPIKDKHSAIGSGMQFAIAAMEAGCSPKEAVKIAIKRDPTSGMGVKNYEL